MKVLSLRTRLALIILVPLILISLVAGYWRFATARQTAEILFDRTLLASTLAIARDVAVSGGDALSEATRDLMHDTSGGPVFYHVHGPDGVFVTGYATPPVLQGAAAEPDGVPVFYEAIYRGEAVRVVRLREKIEVEGITGFATVTVWQTFEARNRFVRDLALRATLLMATLIATVAAVVWLGINFGLRPLTELQSAISQRSSDELGRIRRPLPREVSGIVGTLNSLFEQLQQALRSRDVFISDATHQLRNPIAGLLSMAEAVRTAPDPEEAARRAGELADAARQTSRLANQLLSYERARAVTTADTDSFDLVAVTDEVAKRNKAAFAEQGLTLDLHLPDCTMTVVGDRLLVGEAIENLVDNAAKHGGAGLTRVELCVSRRDDGSSCVTVTDNGRGIAPADRDLVFNRFHQVEPHEGSGLGLSIVETVARKHEGDVSLDDAKPGLRVTLRFPSSATSRAPTSVDA